MRLIGINGFKTSGKDSTFLSVAQAQPQLNVQRVGFADKLKIIAAQAIGFDMSDENLISCMDECKESWRFAIHQDGNDKRYGSDVTFTGRQYLQWFGGQARVVFGDTFWIDQVLPTPAVDKFDGLAEQDNILALRERYSGVDILCVTDVRYENEAQRIKDLGGEIWVVKRPGVESDGHGSETPLPDELIDNYISNSHGLGWLQSEVEEVLV
jgi:hypothetical protein